LLDPQCPVVSPGGCPSKPASKEIAVLDAAGRDVAGLKTAADGTFKITLPPGKYQVVEVTTGGAPPSLKAVPFTVVDGQFTHVVLLFDTGIR
jgi:hypothetical protein